MTRLKADFLLLLACFIWGTAFVAQKAGMDGIGPLGFVGSRFLLSFILVAPFAWREHRKRAGQAVAWNRKDLLILCVSFFSAVSFQQAGLATTSVTNAGFLTSLYIIIVPFLAWAFLKDKVSPRVWAASFIALVGIWLLGGMSVSALNTGDWQVLASALCFAVHIIYMGKVVMQMRRPLLIAAIQYAFVAGAGLIGGGLFESITLEALQVNLWPILYAGILSGGVAYTLQAVAQQYMSASRAAIIFSTEALFAALAGAALLGERLDLIGWGGCILILVAILVVEAGPLLRAWSRGKIKL